MNLIKWMVVGGDWSSRKGSLMLKPIHWSIISNILYQGCTVFLWKKKLNVQWELEMFGGADLIRVEDRECQLIQRKKKCWNERQYTAEAFIPELTVIHLIPDSNMSTKWLSMLILWFSLQMHENMTLMMMWTTFWCDMINVRACI